MDDRERRLADALRSGPRPSPPEGLNRTIKDEIPENLAPGGRLSSAHARGWLLAATVILMLGAGWVALRLVMTDASTPVAVIADRPGPAPSEESESGPSPSTRSKAAPTEPAAVDVGNQEQEGAGAEMAEPVAAEERTGRPDAADREFTAPPAAPPAASTKRERQASPSHADQLAPQAREEDAAEAIRASSPAPPVPAAALSPEVKNRVLGSTEADTLSTEGRTTQRASSSDRAEFLSYDQIRDMIEGGTLPSRSAIDADRLVNHFDYGDRSPWRRGNISLFVEGGAAPLRESRWRTVRIGVRSSASADPIAHDAELGVQFDPTAVDLYRRVGETRSKRPDVQPMATFDLGDLDGDLARSWLFEVRLRAESSLDHPVAVASLRYREPDGDPMEIERSLKVGHVASSWRTSSTALRTAILASEWARLLEGASRGTEEYVLLQLARELGSAPDAGESVQELIRLIEQTVKLRSPGRPR